MFALECVHGYAPGRNGFRSQTQLFFLRFLDGSWLDLAESPLIFPWISELGPVDFFAFSPLNQ